MVFNEWGWVDVFLNNVGIVYVMFFFEMMLELWMCMLDVYIEGIYVCMCVVW